MSYQPNKYDTAGNLTVNVSSMAVGTANAFVVSGPSAQTALNTDLITGNVTGWYDASQFKSGAIEIIGTAGISAGAITFETTNDYTLANSGVTMAVNEQAVSTSPALFAAITIAASTTRLFTFPISARYVRARISTAFTGGSVQAVATFSAQPYATPSISTTYQGTQTVVLGAGTNNYGYIGIQLPLAVADNASVAVTATATLAAITPAFGSEYIVNIPVTAVSGTTPTLDVVVQESNDSGTNWVDVYHFPRITATGSYNSPKLLLKGNRIRYVQTVSGTTPSFTRAINRFQGSTSVSAIRRIFDRAVSLTTLNATTTTAAGTPLNVQDCRNIQLTINIGAATTPPALQLQGSEDGGTTWYSIGSPLTAVASSTVNLTVNNVNTELVRALVSTAGATVTAGYVAIKAF